MPICGAVLLLSVQWVSAVSLGQSPAGADTATQTQSYQSTQLDCLLAAASRINAQIPERLQAYRGRVETEMLLALIDSAGRKAIQ